VLDVLWKHGEASNREIFDRLENEWGYSTAKTVIDRMHRKGLLSRRSVHGINVYQPEVTRPQALARWLRFFADHLLGVDSDTAVALFAKSQHIDAKELAELRKLAASLKDNSKKSG
jgi:predicted transcriptional regulator